MGLNIKNNETCRLAGELARLTGETMTGADAVAPVGGCAFHDNRIWVRAA